MTPNQRRLILFAVVSLFVVGMLLWIFRPPKPQTFEGKATTPGAFTADRRSAIVANIAGTLEEVKKTRADFNQQVSKISDSLTHEKREQLAGIRKSFDASVIALTACQGAAKAAAEAGDDETLAEHAARAVAEADAIQALFKELHKLSHD